MASILSRLARLQEAAASTKNGKIAVIFRDGTVKLLDGGGVLTWLCTPLTLWSDLKPKDRATGFCLTF